MHRISTLSNTYRFGSISLPQESDQSKMEMQQLIRERNYRSYYNLDELSRYDLKTLNEIKTDCDKRLRPEILKRLNSKELLINESRLDLSDLNLTEGESLRVFELLVSMNRDGIRDYTRPDLKEITQVDLSGNKLSSVPYGFLQRLALQSDKGISFKVDVELKDVADLNQSRRDLNKVTLCQEWESHSSSNGRGDECPFVFGVLRYFR